MYLLVKFKNEKHVQKFIFKSAQQIASSSTFAPTQYLLSWRWKSHSLVITKFSLVRYIIMWTSLTFNFLQYSFLACVFPKQFQIPTADVAVVRAVSKTNYLVHDNTIVFIRAPISLLTSIRRVSCLPISAILRARFTVKHQPERGNCWNLFEVHSKGENLKSIRSRFSMFCRAKKNAIVVLVKLIKFSQ